MGLRTWLGLKKRKAAKRLKRRSDPRKTKGFSDALKSNLFAQSRIRRTPPRLSALSILDEMSEVSWSPEIKLQRLSRVEARSQIEEAEVDCLFLESAWRGNAGQWEYAMRSPNFRHSNAQALLEVVQAARKKRLPIVFWNKEDPLHFHDFLPFATLCDIVLTTDQAMVGRYQHELGHDRVFALPFAAQPTLCNPANRFRYPMETICFAGAYYRVGHEERRRYMDALLPVISSFEGVIYDRFSEEKNDRYSFPEQYKRHVRPRIDFMEMSREYRRFKAFLNVNTVLDSETMMSRRVYELLACGTPVISSPSAALEKQFPEIVLTASTAREAACHADRLLGDEHYWRCISHIGYREVMRHHTYAQRLDTIANALGRESTRSAHSVSIVSATRRPQMIERLTDSIAKQNYPNFETIIVTQGYSTSEIERLGAVLDGKSGSKPIIIKIIPMDENQSLGARLNFAIKEATGEYIVNMDDDDFYYPNYVSDMLLPFSYTDAELIGKQEAYCYIEPMGKTVLLSPGRLHCHTEFVRGPTFVARRSLFDKFKFVDKTRGADTELLRTLAAEGAQIYSADSFNFVQFRGNAVDHTWPASEQEIMRRAKPVCDGFPEHFVNL
jgi:spore maturation protein CgeB